MICLGRSSAFARVFPRRWHLVCGGVFCVFYSLVLLGGVEAEPLNEALAAAYLTNPTLQAERASLRAVDEEVPRAHSGWRPVIIGEADRTYHAQNTGPPLPADGQVYSKGYEVTLRQSIFRGFRTLNSIREADANVFAGREDLRSQEQLTLLDGVRAYMDVVRDQAIVRLRENNVKVLSEQLRATKDRFEVGEVTKTDVAQSEARRSGAVSDLSLAKANLRTSRATYERVIGHLPSHLVSPPSIDHMLPHEPGLAIDIGHGENPVIQAAIFREQSSRHAIDRIRGELLPEVSLEATYEQRYNPSTIIDRTEDTTVIGRLTMPFYQAGEVSARVRQAKQVFVQRQQEVEEARVQVQNDVVAAWARYTAAQAQIISDNAQVTANRTALDGVREEEKVGQRTVLDVLDAEQELLDSQVNLVRTERDEVVAAYALLSAIGRLTAADLGLSVPLYDAEEHYRRVKRKWFGLGPRLNHHSDHHSRW